MPAGVAPDPGKPLGEVAAAEELLHHAADDRPEETILLSACQCTKSGGRRPPVGWQALRRPVML
jgi:hypothetical protein